MINAVSNVNFNGIKRERDFFHKKPVDFASVMSDINMIGKVPESIAADEMNAIAINVKNTGGVNIAQPELLVTAALLKVSDMKSDKNKADYMIEVTRLAHYTGCLDETSDAIMDMAREVGVANKVGQTLEQFNPTSFNRWGVSSAEGYVAPVHMLSQKACITR